MKLRHAATSGALPQLARERRRPDVLVANILADIIIRLIPHAQKTMKPNGYFIMSGIIQQKKADVVEALQREGFTIVDTLTMEDWVTIIAKLG